MTPAAALLSLAATPALADFGAIAHSPRTGGYGVGWQAATRVEAARLAMDACGGYGPGCAVTLAFENACGALAASGDTIHASAAGATLAEAEARALAACAKLNDAGCEIEVSFCSNR